MAKTASQGLDLSSLSTKERKALTEMLAKTGVSDVSQLAVKAPSKNDPGYRAKCLEVKALCIKLCQEHGVAFQHMFTATDKERTTYKDPSTGKTWSGYGPIPDWLKGHKDDPEYQANGASVVSDQHDLEDAIKARQEFTIVNGADATQ